MVRKAEAKAEARRGKTSGKTSGKIRKERAPVVKAVARTAEEALVGSSCATSSSGVSASMVRRASSRAASG